MPCRPEIADVKSTMIRNSFGHSLLKAIISRADLGTAILLNRDLLNEQLNFNSATVERSIILLFKKAVRMWSRKQYASRHGENIYIAPYCSCFDVEV